MAEIVVLCVVALAVSELLVVRVVFEVHSLVVDALLLSHVPHEPDCFAHLIIWADVVVV